LAAPVEHGTRKSYRQRGCRCAECRAWAAKSIREYAASYRAETGRGLWGNYRKPTTSRHGNAVRRSVRLSIYERDEYVCQLCLELVDMDLDPNDRMAATLDHIECQSWTSEPDHTAGNLRLAHRACNSRRLNRV